MPNSYRVQEAAGNTSYVTCRHRALFERALSPYIIWKKLVWKDKVMFFFCFTVVFFMVVSLSKSYEIRLFIVIYIEVMITTNMCSVCLKKARKVLIEKSFLCQGSRAKIKNKKNKKF